MSGVSSTKGSPKSTTKSGSERALDSGKSTDIPPNMSNDQTPSVPETMATDTKKVKNPYLLKRSLTSHEDRITTSSEFLIILSE